MQMLYQSEQFVVVRFEIGDPEAAGPAGPDAPTAQPATELAVASGPATPANPAAVPRLTRGGYEIVDKFSRKEIFLDGAMAEHFQQGVQALVAQGPTQEAMDEFIGRFTMLAQQPVVLH